MTITSCFTRSSSIHAEWRWTMWCVFSQRRDIKRRSLSVFSLRSAERQAKASMHASLSMPAANVYHQSWSTFGENLEFWWSTKLWHICYTVYATFEWWIDRLYTALKVSIDSNAQRRRLGPYNLSTSWNCKPLAPDTLRTTRCWRWRQKRKRVPCVKQNMTCLLSIKRTKA